MNDKMMNEINISSPGIYQIQVLGEVCREIWEHFEGETEQIKKDKNGQLISFIKVHVHDQAELSGIIKLLYDWNHVLIKVRREGENQELEV